MKFVRLVLSLVCQTTSYGANHSQDQVLLSVSWVKSLKEKLETVRESDAILRDEMQVQGLSGLDRDIWQYFTVNTGVRSVGVMGDGRTYDYTIAIRAITSIDGMTADFAKIPWEVLQKISVRIVNEVDHVNRIVYDITSKPPATVE